MAGTHPRVDLVAVADFVRRQGPARPLLSTPEPLDDDATSAGLAPAAARGARGLPLPTGLADDAAVAAVAFPGGRARVADAADLLGALLQQALGLQRREDEHHYADHRSLASGRAAYPVHAVVVDRAGARHLDPYRHALVDLDPGAADAAAGLGDPGAGSATVILAARYSDLPAGYGVTRASVTETELGMATRALFCAAELFGVVASTISCGPVVERAARLVAATGPGVWSTPVVVVLDGVTPRPSRPLVPVDAATDVADAVVAADRFDPATHEVQAVSATRLPAAAGPPAARRGPAELCPTGTFDTTWAEVAYRRSSGRAPGGRHGFALRPWHVPAAQLDDLAAWAAVAPVDDAVRAVWPLLTVRVAVQRVTGRADGVHRLTGSGLRLERADDGVLDRLHRRGGQATTADVAVATRHAACVWLLSADVDAALDLAGPAGWSLLQLACGWTLHGLALAASAHGLISRPTRSYDDHSIAHALGLPRRDTPLFMNVCGRSAYDPPVLDLRP